MNGIILLVEDNPDDVKLTLRAFKHNNLGNHILVACDGAEALAYLFIEAARQLGLCWLLLNEVPPTTP